MSQPIRIKRLDEILIEMGLISDEEIREALMRQKAHGGKIGSQLLYHRYISEDNLVEALIRQFRCKGVVLSNLNIDDSVLKLIPKKLAIARKVLPFEYDIDNNVLKIACENPYDQKLIDEMEFTARGKFVALYIAAEIALNTAIAKYYLEQDISLDDNLLLEIPDITTDMGKVPTIDDNPAQAKSTPDNSILLVTDEEYTTSLIESLLNRDDKKVTIAESVEQAMDQINQHKYNALLIREGIPGDYFRLVDRMRKMYPPIQVRFYESTSSLLMDNNRINSEANILEKILEIFTSLLNIKIKESQNHGARVGHYTGRLCDKLKLSPKDRLAITTAAYVHDLAHYYYDNQKIKSEIELISYSAKLLSSLNFPPVIVAMLQSMYKEIEGRYADYLPIEILGGNILTICDLFCKTVTTDEDLKLDTFDVVRKKLRDSAGKLLLPEIVEPFIELIQSKLLDSQTSYNAGQIMLYSESGYRLPALVLRLQNEGFKMLAPHSRQTLLELFNRRRPEILLLALPKDKKSVYSIVDDLKNDGINLQSTPTFLLTEDSSDAGLTELFELGFEDIIVLEDNLDVLVMKIKKQFDRIKIQNKSRANMEENTVGAKGRLADMNLIDLLQALGPSQKTVKISIKNNEPEQAELLIYLERGNIIFAQKNELTGAEAVYEGITWAEGAWVVLPVTVEELPRPNNDQSNESILMEGCRLMDEKTRTGELI